MDLVITFIGIVTLACGGTNPDPCSGPFPMKVTAYVPDGRQGATVCKSPGERIRPHDAFVRLRGVAAKPGTSWPGALECEDTVNGHCMLYPLSGDEITIAGVTTGLGVQSLETREVIRWRTYHTGLTIDADTARSRSAAWMTLAAGSVTLAQTPMGAWQPVLRVANGKGDTIITATSDSSTNTLVIPDGANIDVMNVPRMAALNYTDAMNNHIDEEDHFFLHYQLATTSPPFPCCGPASTGPSCRSSSAEVASHTHHHRPASSGKEARRLLSFAGCSGTNWP